MAELQQGLWVVKCEERYEPTFSYRWDLVESWLPDLVAEGRRLAAPAALDRLVARYAAGAVFTTGARACDGSSRVPAAEIASVRGAPRSRRRRSAETPVVGWHWPLARASRWRGRRLNESGVHGAVCCRGAGDVLTTGGILRSRLRHSQAHGTDVLEVSP